MPDNRREHQVSPWTRGPWRWFRSNGMRFLLDQSDTSVIPGIEWIPGSDTQSALANGELIALAPEMAEAILTVETGDVTRNITPDEWALVVDVADRLRAIGGIVKDDSNPAPALRACRICNRLVTPHYVKPLDERGVCDYEQCQQLADKHMGKRYV